jgi:flavin reductase (DIM6/NTAB) family NADH-FMN oxidoreductase RutF
MKVDPSKLHRLFYPQVPLVLAAKVGNRVSAMPVVAYALISDSPPFVAVACDPRTFTYRLCSKSDSFSLSILDSTKLECMESLVRIRGGDVSDKLQAVGLDHSTGKSVDVPVIDGAAATMECSVRSKRRVGDHILLVGKVESCEASEDFTDFWDFRNYRPILYTGWKEGMTVFPKAPRRGVRSNSRH